jgi:hypothetical protein
LEESVRRWSPLFLVAVASLLCSCAVPGWARAAARAVPASPGRLTVVGEADPGAAAVAASRALFRSSDVAVLAAADDRSGLPLAAAAAVDLRVPLLLEPSGATATAVGAELDRLGAGTVLAVGAVRVGQLGKGRTVVRAAGTRPAVTSAERKVPAVTRGTPPDGELVVATGGPETVAGVATARAAGVPVLLTGGTADVRSSAAAVAGLARARPTTVVALGAAFAGEHGLGWQLATAATGRQLPGGGQLVFPGRTLVALYGTPGTAALGVLGEQDVSASIERARRMAAAYRPLLGGPVVPTFEIIATVASGAAGPDGNYSTELDPEVLRPWVQAAAAAGVYVILDLQPGRSDFLGQAQRYVSLLRMPNVGLALDPEWRLAPGQLPLHQIGSVDVHEINRVVAWLADLTRDRLLPQKLLVLHQFRTSMIRGRDRLDTSREELAIAVHVDGQGGQGSKQATWSTLHRDVPAGPLFWGWKNFYDEDHPMLTPDQTVRQVHPTPSLISYQ